MRIARSPHRPSRPGNPAPALRLGFTTHLIVWLVLGVLIAAGAGALLWWALGADRTLSAGDRFELAKLALIVAGGVGAVIALTVAYRRQRLREFGEHREDTKLYSERFSRCAEQLGNGQAAVRLAGVHALAGLADDDPAGRATCVEVLCAYLRIPYDASEPADGAARREWGGHRQVRLTIIRVIAEHLRRTDATSWRGVDLDFTEAVFDGGDLTDCTFAGGTVLLDGATFVGRGLDLRGSSFLGGKVSFARSEVAGRLGFDATRLAGGLVDFTAARFTGGVASFRDASLVGAEMSFRTADFAGGTVDLSAPASYKVPPVFDDGKPPKGLLLPGKPAPALVPSAASTPAPAAAPASPAEAAESAAATPAKRTARRKS